MAFIHSVKDLIPNFSSPLQFGMQTLATTAAINTTTSTTTTLPTGVAIHQGLLRIKGTSYPGAGAGVISGLKVTATDGTNTRVLRGPGASFAASDLPDEVTMFVLDIGATSFTVAVTMTNVANGQLLYDFEIAGNV